jgi:RHS repeat-associated protein
LIYEYVPSSNKLTKVSDKVACASQLTLPDTIFRDITYAAGQLIHINMTTVKPNVTMDLIAGSEVKVHQKLHLPKENGLLALVTVKKQACPDVKFSEGFNQQSTANYLYDLAGNVIYDPNKKVTFQYNHLNLAYQMIGSENDTLTMIYGADGRLLQRRYKQNQSIIQKIDYLSNVELHKDTVKEIYHKDGRLEKKNGVWQYEYWLKDHLGNLRSAFRDINNDSYISQNEIITRNDYYAFGLEMAGSHLLNGNRFAYGGKERLEQMNLGLLDFGARNLDKALGRWMTVDPLADEENQVDLSPYAYAWNNPVKMIDPDGKLPIIPIIWAAYEIGSAIYDGYQAYKTVSDKNASTAEKTAAVGGVVLSAVLPGGGYGTASKAVVKAADKVSDVGKAVDKAGDAKKTFQTYTKDPKNPADGIYSGKTSGTGTPRENVAKRDKNHHMNETHGPAKLDKSSTNSDAIRGREQNLIDANGGARKQGGTSGNTNRGVAEKNKNAQKYDAAAKKEFNY